MSASATDPPSDAQSGARQGAERLRIGGLTPLTTLDFPGELAAVVFCQGCPWRCRYCQNGDLLAARRDDLIPWSRVRDLLDRRRGLLDAVVFSGGEPTLDPALPQAIDQVRALGFKVGLHSAGIHPQRLQAVLPRVDWVGLDIKAPLADDAGHARVTGRRGSASPVRRSLAALVQQARTRDLPFECRTTAHPALLDATALLAVADDMAAAGVVHWVLQIARAQGAIGTLGAVGADYPSTDTLRRLRARLPAMTVRRA